MKRRFIRNIFAALGLAGILGGCAASKPPPCPNFLILGEGAELVKFRPGPGRDVTDILFEAKIVDFQGTCDQTKNEVSISLGIVFNIRRGPANLDRKAAFRYFVAIPKFFPRKEGKRTFPITVPFKENQPRVFFRDELELRIPLRPKETGADYEIYLGLQLTADELEFNRGRTRRR